MAWKNYVTFDALPNIFFTELTDYALGLIETIKSSGKEFTSDELSLYIKNQGTNFYNTSGISQDFTVNANNYNFVIVQNSSPFSLATGMTNKTTGTFMSAAGGRVSGSTSGFPEHCFIVLSVDDDSKKAFFGTIFPYYKSSGVLHYKWDTFDYSRIDNTPYGSPDNLYTVLEGRIQPPIVISYKPIAFFKTPEYHRLLTMIRDEETNQGQQVVNAPLSVLKARPSESCIEEILKNLPVGKQQTVAWTSNTNRLDFERLADTTVLDTTFRNYDVKYYINGERQDVLTHQLTTYDDYANAPYVHYLSYLIDDENELVRPSFVTVRGTISCDYNTETVGDAQQSLWYTWLANGYSLGFPGPHEFDPEPGHPAQPGQPGSGDAANDRTTGNTGFPALPSSQLTETGFFTLWNPTREQLINLAEYMWSSLDITNWKRLFADPMDCIIGLHMLPVDTRLLRGESPYDEKDINVGNISTGKPAYICRNQFIEISFGKVTIPAQTDSYMDYSPYMKAELHLPYIGVVSINPDDISRREVELRYHIDVATGTCVAYLRCETDTGYEILYEWTGNCAAQIPFTGAGYKSIIESSIRIAVGVIGAVTGGPAGTALAASELGSVATSTATNVGQMKPEIARSGSIGNTSGYMAVQDAYFILSYPRQWRAEDQESIEGYPLYTREKLSNMDGYTIIHDMHLEGMSCTSSEAEEIMSLLKGGVIL